MGGLRSLLLRRGLRSRGGLLLLSGRRLLRGGWRRRLLERSLLVRLLLVRLLVLLLLIGLLLVRLLVRLLLVRLLLVGLLERSLRLLVRCLRLLEGSLRLLERCLRLLVGSLWLLERRLLGRGRGCSRLLGWSSGRLMLGQVVSHGLEERLDVGRRHVGGGRRGRDRGLGRRRRWLGHDWIGWKEEERAWGDDSESESFGRST